MCFLWCRQGPPELGESVIPSLKKSAKKLRSPSEVHWATVEAREGEETKDPRCDVLPVSSIKQTRHTAMLIQSPLFPDIVRGRAALPPKTSGLLGTLVATALPIVALPYAESSPPGRRIPDLHSPHFHEVHMRTSLVCCCKAESGRVDVPVSGLLIIDLSRIRRASLTKKMGNHPRSQSDPRRSPGTGTVVRCRSKNVRGRGSKRFLPRPSAPGGAMPVPGMSGLKRVESG